MNAERKYSSLDEIELKSRGWIDYKLQKLLRIVAPFKYILGNWPNFVRKQISKQTMHCKVIKKGESSDFCFFFYVSNLFFTHPKDVGDKRKSSM